MKRLHWWKLRDLVTRTIRSGIEKGLDEVIISAHVRDDVRNWARFQDVEGFVREQTLKAHALAKKSRNRIGWRGAVWFTRK